jgi:hypothetical protein
MPESKRKRRYPSPVGQKFGRLTIVGLSDKRYGRIKLYHCRCDCGRETDKSLSDLKCGETVSCGCYRIEALKKRESNTFITHNGETLCVSDWARRIGVSRTTLQSRLKRWPIEKALTRPTS